jgi:mono/diheme cytochrome c family protein
MANPVVAASCLVFFGAALLASGAASAAAPAREPEAGAPEAGIQMDARALYQGSCASCHGLDGEGGLGHGYPKLREANPFALAHAAAVALKIDLGGGSAREGGRYMPTFSPSKGVVDVLTDDQTAQIANYVVATFGSGQAAGLTAQDVGRIRQGVLAGTPVYLRAFWAPLTIGLGGVAALVLLARAWRRSRRARKTA